MLRDFLAPLRGGNCGRRTVVLAAITLAGVASLFGCGVKGPLKPPPAPATATGERPSETPPAPAQETSAQPAQLSPLEPAPQAPSTAP